MTFTSSETSFQVYYVMTKAERDTLSALSWLGRRQWWSAYDVTRVRLKWKFHRDSTLSWHHTPDFMSNRRFAQYGRTTSARLWRLARKGYVEEKYQRVKAGSKLQIHYGPLYKVTKEGRAALKR